MGFEWIRDTNRAAHEVRVQCYSCGKMHLLSNVWIDTNGPAFRAYYCEPCKERTEVDGG